MFNSTQFEETKQIPLSIIESLNLIQGPRAIDPMRAGHGPRIVVRGVNIEGSIHRRFNCKLSLSICHYLLIVIGYWRFFYCHLSPVTC